MKIGDSVIYNREMKALDYGTVGIIHSIYGEKCTIIYTQNSMYDENGKIEKNSPTKVYSHSCLLTELLKV